MRPDLAEIANRLSCPDDATPLAPASDGLRCVHCSRVFPFQPPNLLEILPSKPTEISSSEIPPGYGHAYLQAYSQVWKADDDAKPWETRGNSGTETRETRKLGDRRNVS